MACVNPVERILGQKQKDISPHSFLSILFLSVTMVTLACNQRPKFKERKTPWLAIYRFLAVKQEIDLLGKYVEEVACFFYKAPLVYTTVIIKPFASSQGTMAREQILQQVEKQSGLRGLFFFCLFIGKQTLRKLMFLRLLLRKQTLF